MNIRKLAVIDYGTGNLHSVVKAFEFLNAKVTLAQKPKDIKGVDAIIFPGQGSFDHCMTSLRDSGLDRAIKTWISEDRPFFGICLGLQVLFGSSEEGKLPGLGIFNGSVVRFSIGSQFKVPHMGWNQVAWGLPEDHWARREISENDQFYFVHSYRVETNDARLHCISTDYGGIFTSGIISSNCIATQFHPEKSQSKGIQLYRNFLENIE
ncbi:MAG: imidazole glycerol phosphate synthase subunit HisH [Opitutae bacterium]